MYHESSIGVPQSVMIIKKKKNVDAKISIIILNMLNDSLVGAIAYYLDFLINREVTIIFVRYLLFNCVFLLDPCMTAVLR